MIRRRHFVALAGAALAAPGVLLAQPAKRVYRIGLLDDAIESAREETWRFFRDRLRQLVLADGNDLAYEVRYARGATERLPALAAELVALKPEVIVCAGTPATIATMKATSTLPIVFAGAGDPVGSGLVKSLARPGGNVTGTANILIEIAGKQVELLRQLAPSARQIAYLSDASNKATVGVFREFEASARAMNVSARLLDGRTRAAIEKAFETIKRERIQALFVGASGSLLEHRDQILHFAAREKIPAVYGRREYVDAGGLVSYSADYRWVYRRTAEYVHRILKGAKPGDLPVEGSQNLRMVINMKTARVLGIKIPESIKAGVNEVIQ